MTNSAETLNNLLVGMFNQIIKIEYGTLVQGHYKDLTISEFHTIDNIGPDNHNTMSDVAGRLGITLGTLTTSVNRLIKKGYVYKEKSQEDKRIYHLRLTEKGVGAFHAHATFHQEMIQVILEHTTSEEQELFSHILQNVHQFFLEKYQSC